MRLKLWTALAASTIALSSLFTSSAGAEGRFDDEKGQKDDKKSAKGDKSDKSEKAKPGAKKFALSPEGLKWHLGMEGIAKLYDKVFDDEYLPLYKKAAPGPETEALDAELKQRKGELRRSKVEFGDTPTGVDQTSLKGEYSYANGESMGRLTLRSGTERYFFFFNDKLWKVYDEHKLKKGTPLGETYEGAVKVLAGKFGSQPKKVPANDKGQVFDESVWTTPDMVIRAIDRGNIIAVVYADREVQEDLAKRRRNKPKDDMAMDKDVAAALKKNEPPPDQKKKAEDAKKKPAKK